MAEKSLFYNAFPDSESVTGYDRNYNGDDISDWFSIVCDTGVVKAGLAVTAGNGLSVNIAVGKATVRGKGYINNAVLNLTLATAPTGANPRYDMVVLRMDNTQTASARRTYLCIKTGDNSVPAAADLADTTDVKELLLAYVAVQPNATSISQSNITDCRGGALCPWFTAVKGYDDYYDAIVQQFEYNGTMASAGTVVITNLPSSLYNNKYSLVEVYCNGLKEENTDYTVGTSSGYITITFTATKSAGAQISVVLNNFIDGEGLNTAINSYNEWVQDVEDLKTAVGEYTYVCNGLNDNVNISNIVNTFIAGGTDYGSMKLKIVGNFGCMNGGQYPVTVGGSGTSSSPYQIFRFNSGNRRVTLDFSCCSEVSVPISGVYCTIFDGQINIEGLNLVTSGTTAGTVIAVFKNNSGEDVRCTNCRFWVNGYQNSRIAYGGIFENCRGSISNVTGNTYCFEPSADILRVTGGEYIAYTGQSTAKSAVIGQSQANAVSILYGVNMPVIARSGFYQTNSILQYSGGGQVRATDLITTLTDVIASGTIRNTIAINKPNSL